MEEDMIKDRGRGMNYKTTMKERLQVRTHTHAHTHTRTRLKYWPRPVSYIIASFGSNSRAQESFIYIVFV